MEASFCLAPAIIELAGFVIVAYQYFHGHRYKYFLCTTCAFLSAGMHHLLWSIAISMLSVEIFVISALFFIPTSIFTTMKGDTITKDQADSKNFVAVTIISVVYVAIMLMQGVATVITYPNGEQSVFFTGPSFFGYILLGIYPFVIYLYAVIRMILNAPRALKKFTIMFLFGYVTGGVCYFTFLLSGASSVIPGIQFLGLTSIIVMVIIYVKKPTILFILPFKAIRLTVMETKGGIVLFTHRWGKNKGIPSDDLYGGVIQGINAIINESLDSGDIQEIKLANGVLLIQRDSNHNIAAVVVSTRSSRTLRDGLKVFEKRFIEEFGSFFPNYTDVSKYEGANSIISECFPFIPDYD